MRNENLTMKSILSCAKYKDSCMADLLNENVKQFVSDELIVPVWKIEYSYTTNRGNEKIATKYIFAHETDWDVICLKFYDYIERFNNNNQHRQLSNVKILDSEYVGEFILEIDN